MRLRFLLACPDDESMVRTLKDVKNSPGVGILQRNYVTQNNWSSSLRTFVSNAMRVSTIDLRQTSTERFVKPTVVHDF